MADTATLEEEIRRKRVEDLLAVDETAAALDETDPDPNPTDGETPSTPEPQQASIYEPATKKSASFVLVPVTPAPVAAAPNILPQATVPTAPAPGPSPNIQTDPETGTRFVQDPTLGKIPRGELATAADKAAQPLGAQLPPVDVAGNVPVRRGELIGPDPDAQAYMTSAGPTGGYMTSAGPVGGALVGRAPSGPMVPPAPDQLSQVEKALPARVAAPDQLAQVERGQLVSTPPGTAPKAVGRAALIPTPPKVQLGGLISVPPAPAPKARVSEFGLTPDEYKAVQGAPAVTPQQAPSGAYEGPPAMSAPNGSAPAALIIHHTSGRGDAANVTEGWRTERPGVGAQMIMDRDGTIHDTKQEFGYGGTGHFLHSVIPGVSNQTAVGIEVVAKDDADMTPAQLSSLQRLAGPGGPYANTPVYGHSQVSPSDRENEGVRGVAAINEARIGRSQAPGAAIPSAAGGITGRATTFGYNDPMDPGVGAPKLGQLSTNNTDLIGAAVPQEALQRYVSAHPADWRKARLEVTTKDGRNVLVPIVDLGPRDTSDARGVVADFTQGLTNLTKNTGEENYQFRIIPNAGPDVMSHPQEFADEQAAIKSGIDTGAQFRTKPAAGAGTKKASYVLAPVSGEQSAAVQQAQAFDNQSQLSTLSQLADSNQNVIGLYKSLDKDVPGVSAGMRAQFQANLKPQIIDLMKQKDPSLSDEAAWTKAQSDVNALDVGSDFWNKFVGSFQQLGPLLQQATGVAAEQSHVNAFLDQTLPKGTDADKHALLTKLYAMPPEQRGAYIAGLIPNQQAGVPGQDAQQVVSALDRLNDPNFSKQQADQMAKSQADLKQRMATDPRLVGSPAAFASENLAQIPEMIAAAGIPPLMAAQVSNQVREQMKADHPEYSEQDLDEKAAYSTLIQFVGQEAAGRLMGAGAGAMIQGIKTPVKRAIAQALIQTGGGAAVGGATQAGTNLATGAPIGQGVGPAMAAGGLQGGVMGAVHGAGELLHRAPSPEAPAPAPVPETPSVGPKGAPVRGPTDATLAATAPQPELPTQAPEASAQPAAEGPLPPLPFMPAKPPELPAQPELPVQARQDPRLASYRQETTEDLQSAVALNNDPLAAQVLSERERGAEQDEAQRQAAITETQQAARAPTGQDNLLQAITQFGGLPNPQRMKTLAGQGETMTGEMARVHDAWKALPLDAKRELANNGITYNKLFTHDAAPLDTFRGNLAQHPGGFDYGTTGELLSETESALAQAATLKKAAIPPPKAPPTQEDVARATFENGQQRAQTGAPGTAHDDYIKAQRDLLQPREPAPLPTPAAAPEDPRLVSYRQETTEDLQSAIALNRDPLAAQVLRERVGAALPTEPARVPPPEAPHATPPVTVGATEPWVSAIANRFTAERAARGQLGDLIHGEGYTKEQLRAVGLQMGPEEVNQHVSDLMHNTGDPKLQAAAVTAEEARLSQVSNAASRASEADPSNQALRTAANSAFKELTDFHNGPVARLKNNWHAQGMTLQGEVPVDLATYNGLREDYLNKTGEAPPSSLEPKLRKTAKAVADAAIANQEAMSRLSAEIERQTANQILPSIAQIKEDIARRMSVEPCRA